MAQAYQGYGRKYSSPFINIQIVHGMYFNSDPDTHINSITIYHNLYNIYVYNVNTYSHRPRTEIAMSW